jgi:predicted ATPase/class 3 adenylate cyclase
MSSLRCVRDRTSTVSAERTRSLPSGRVTFLFTDIEGSTKILKRLPHTAADLFERHNDIVRHALRRHTGHEIRTEGDSFFVAYDDADEALASCSSVQADLAAEEWPDGGTIRVRMGLHTGTAAPRGQNYVALAVHQAARISSAAHGGQVIVSDATLAELRRPAPGNVVPLGKFRVRDFDEPPLLYRLDPVGVPVVDRPIRALPAGGHNLVRPPTSFVGRDREMAQIASLLQTGQILNLVGPGGTGKTRLAIEVGLHAADDLHSGDDWSDGVWLVGLADVEDGSLVAAAIADALGLAPRATDRWPDVISWARDSSSLLIVDNLENHLATCSQLLPELIRQPGVAVLATSREPLQVAGESVFRLGALDLPAVDDEESDVRHSPAVELFVDRARARRADFELDERSVPDVARVCSRLDGLPLAIEIAAARVGVLSVAGILDGLQDRFALLRSSDPTQPQRHRTMTDLLAWSYDLLDPAERIAFRRLAVFGGTYTVASAVDALTDPDLPADDIPELVWSLVDKSLVVADLAENGTRYRLLETVKEFAERHLVEHGEGLATGRRLAASLLARVGPWLTADRQWIGDVGVELANIRSLIALLTPHDQDTAQQLVCSLARYHEAVQSPRNGIEEVSRAMAALDARTSTRVVMLTTLADLHLRCAETTEATELLEAAEELARDVGAPAWNDAAVERTRGEILARAGAYDEAVRVAEQALTRELSLLGQSRMWNLRGIAMYGAGAMSGAFEAFGHELEIYERLGYEANVASAHGNLAELAMQLGRPKEAARLQQLSLDLALEIGQPVMIAFSAIVAARLAAGDGEWALAARLQAAAECELAAASHTLFPADQAELDTLRTSAIEHLGEDAIAVQHQIGIELDVVATAALASQVFTSVRAGATEVGSANLPDERNPS